MREKRARARRVDVNLEFDSLEHMLSEYLTNLSLQIKMSLVLIAGINVLIFYLTPIARELAAIEPNGEAATNAKVVAAVSLVAWFGVIFFGRLIMYNDTLLYALGL